MSLLLALTGGSPVSVNVTGVYGVGRVGSVTVTTGGEVPNSGGGWTNTLGYRKPKEHATFLVYGVSAKAVEGHAYAIAELNLPAMYYGSAQEEEDIMCACALID